MKRIVGWTALVVGGAAAAASVAAKERCFPDNFLFGTATAAYQVEGGWNLTDRTPSIWDDFCRKNDNVQCANVADDFIHRYPSDIAIMKDMGLSSFRFSISWSRVMHWNDATEKMEPTRAGIAFYHALIDTLLAAKIVPIVTLYHWDLPSALHTHINGWLNASIVSHFNAYATLMFDEYGAKVPYWTTFNEPTSFILGGYGYGDNPPGISNSYTAAYTVAHHVLLSHATAVKTFRAKSIDGKIGIVLVSSMAFPLDPSRREDREAAERKLQFNIGWYLNPIVHGDYPDIMKKRAGKHLPSFTHHESALLRGSYDLFMFNHYSSTLFTDCSSPRSETPCHSLSRGWERDLGVDGSDPPGARPSSTNVHGEPICSWFNGYPPGYLALIRWVHAFNRSAPILLTENGWCGNSTIDNQDQLWYYQEYLKQVWQGIQQGIPIVGYTAWSFLDNYEWGSYDPRFGLFHVEYPPQIGSKDGSDPQPADLKRTPRPAALWFGQLAKTKCFPNAPKLTNESTKFNKEKVDSKLTGILIFLMLLGFIAYKSNWRRNEVVVNNEQTPLVARAE
ncbi:hypothetical protein AC1031_005366 [Aphanomyces cochlioides]|nr:hypothetical protein AC1031_005366 [Aphanomyces cochlioides]